MNRPCCVVAALLLCASLGLADGDSLTFEDFERLSRAASPRVAALRAEVAAAQAALDQARVADGPQLLFDLSGGWVSRTQEMDLPTGSLRFGDGRSADASLGLGWTLWSGGGRQAGELAARARLGARRAEEEADSLALGHELRAFFLRALMAREARQAAQVALDRLQRHVKEVELRQSQGMGTAEAVLAARSRLLQARQEMVSRDAVERQARQELGSLAGRPQWAPLVSGSLEHSLSNGDNTARPLANLLALDARVRAARSLVDQRAAGLRPRVDGSAAWHVARPGVDPIDNRWMGYGTLGLRLRWTLWDRGLARQRVAEASHEARALDARRAEAERQAALALVQARDQVETYEEELRLSRERCRVEGQRADLMETRWRAGAATEKEWLDTHDDLRLAELEQGLAAARLRLAENRLLAAAGF